MPKSVLRYVLDEGQNFNPETSFYPIFFPNYLYMPPVSPVLHTEVTMSIGLKTNLRVGSSIPQ